MFRSEQFKTPHQWKKTVQYLEKIIKLVQEHSGCKITILEIPVYSIVNWNQSRRHKDPSTFSDQEQIYQLNGDIRRINKDLKVYSPQFSTDLQCHRKVKKEKHPENRNYYSFSLYSDGIHPGYGLSKYWLRKISDQMRRDC